jgi:hypothetical protein
MDFEIILENEIDGVIVERDLMLEIDIDEILTDLDENEIKKMIKFLKENNYINKYSEVVAKEPITYRIEWGDITRKVAKSRHRLTSEEELIIKTITDKL